MMLEPALPFRVLRLDFEVEAIDPVRLPAFAGSTLRGGIGRALRSLACMTGRPTCDGCGLLRTCPYPEVFDPPGPGQTDSFGVGGHGEAPPLFVLEPPSLKRISVGPGGCWRFGARLFGRAVAQTPLFVESVRRAIAAGLTGERARGRLMRVIARTETGPVDIFDAEAGCLDHLPEDAGRPRGGAPPMAGSRAMILSFRSPMRLQSNGKRVSREAITTHRLVADIVRRVGGLCLVCADRDAVAAVSRWPIRLWLEMADAAPLAQDLHWYDWTRHSFRQGRRITTGGWIGELSLETCPDALQRVFHLGAEIGIGKETVFGFGQYTVQQNS